MKYLPYILLSAILGFFALKTVSNSFSPPSPEEEMIRKMYDEALTTGEGYENLRYLCKRIGGRLSGSPQAAAAVEWGYQTLGKLGLDTVYLQETLVPHWVRGPKEEARIISDHIGWEEVNICALGNSIGTGEWGITAPVVMVEHVEDMKKLGKKKLEGKIVFCNNPFDDKHLDTFDAYSECVSDRYKGAPLAAQYGAVGYILRSLGNAIDEFPHTGNMAYEEGIDKIPAAAICTRDAEKLKGLLTVDPDLSFYMKMQCETFPDKVSYNVIGEIKGSEKPNEVILVSGHLDAWDNGEGAHDDGSGVVQSMEVLRLFKQLEIKPKRTIRCVLWMNEENGTRGAKTYFEWAKNNGETCILAQESDRGGFAPRGFFVDASKDILDSKIEKLRSFKPFLEPYHLHVFEKGFSGVDIKFLKEIGTTCVGYFPDPQRYFDYHHTSNDTFDKVNKRELELGAAGMAALTYLVDEFWEN